ncbi:MAG: hypothetical protein PHE59_03165 [Patescibacteria group bacterium]|nr:hypothetical protein [Patescibacteria group bacterium]MDD5164608.1 hypothetical protein [Patescibacteria group bacterium]MDD5534550.1 hypothetical protein [Patescibacteria group bacterium]
MRYDVNNSERLGLELKKRKEGEMEGQNIYTINFCNTDDDSIRSQVILCHQKKISQKVFATKIGLIIEKFKASPDFNDQEFRPHKGTRILDQKWSNIITDGLCKQGFSVISPIGSYKTY